MITELVIVGWLVGWLFTVGFLGLRASTWKELWLCASIFPLWPTLLGAEVRLICDQNAGWVEMTPNEDSPDRPGEDN